TVEYCIRLLISQLRFTLSFTSISIALNFEFLLLVCMIIEMDCLIQQRITNSFSVKTENRKHFYYG
uniref:Uncharacterized protein n=1 Tax=Anopheles atroparvus TaxID=41427 RepID=A0AAG5D6S8_ANOAO